jgi:hypothetical protein
MLLLLQFVNDNNFLSIYYNLFHGKKDIKEVIKTTHRKKGNNAAMYRRKKELMAKKTANDNNKNTKGRSQRKQNTTTIHINGNQASVTMIGAGEAGQSHKK